MLYIKQRAAYKNWRVVLFLTNNICFRVLSYRIRIKLHTYNYVLTGILYHETKMCACTDIFVKSSMPQAYGSTHSTKYKALLARLSADIIS